MGKYLDLLDATLNRMGFKYDVNRDDNTIRMTVSGDNSSWKMLFRAREEQEQVSVYSYFPENIAEDKRHAIAEYITRANYGLIIGNFEMDFNDGEIRFKTSVDLEDGESLNTILTNLVRVNFSMFDRYYAGFMKIVWGAKSPEAAVKEIEEKS